MKIIDHFFFVASKLCEPSPQSIPNPTQRSYVFRKNKTFFYTNIIIVIINALESQISCVSSRIFLLMILSNIGKLTVFCFTCRSYSKYFNICYSLLTAMTPALLLHLEPDFIFLYSKITLLLPVSVFIVSNSIFLTLFVGGSVMLTTITISKTTMVKTLTIQDPSVIVEKMISSDILTVAAVMVIFIHIFRTMIQAIKAAADANSTAEEALEQQKTFIFSFSHELRNPLNSLLGNLQLVLMSKIPDQVREMVKTSQMCAELLLQLVNNTLDVGKRDVGKLEVSISPTRVYDVLERIWAISSQLMATKKLRSHIKVDKKTPSVLMLDGHRLNQIMMNLIGNSIKFTDAGSISVTVQWLAASMVDDSCFEPKPYDDTDEGTFEKDENLHFLNTMSLNSLHHLDDYYMLSKDVSHFNLQENSQPHATSQGILKIIVRDTGSGMSEAGLGKLFQKFSQVSNDVQKRQIGTGLGLYITKELCIKMDGDIRAYSKPGVGTTFVVCIPTMSIANDDHPRSNMNQRRILGELKEKSFNAIVSDDSAMNATMISEFFKKVGITVVDKAGDVSEVVSKYKKNIEAGVRVDVVTLDMSMSKVGGKTAYQMIREYEVEKGVPPTTLILTSGNYDEELVKQCLTSGSVKKADYFLRKPLSFEEFSSTIYLLKVKQGNT